MTMPSAPWGKSVAIDLYGCEHTFLTDPEKIKEYIREVILCIDMVAHGPTIIEKFGDPNKHPGPGYSAMQFIETSSITIHCDEYEDRVFIDIFSCKDFDAEKAVNFSKEFFKSQTERKTVLIR